MLSDMKERLEQEADGLIVLLERYNIDLKGENRWFLLALNLARKKIPNWPDIKISRGAPKGSRTLDANKRLEGEVIKNALAQLVGIKHKKKPGRPTVPKINPESIDMVKDEYNLSGHGSDKAAIKICVEGYAKPADREREIKYWQKRLSEQRNKIPKNSQ